MVCILRIKEKDPEKKGDWRGEAAESKGLHVLSLLPVSLAVSPPGRRFHGAGLCLGTFSGFQPGGGGSLLLLLISGLLSCPLFGFHLLCNQFRACTFL